MAHGAGDVFGVNTSNISRSISDKICQQCIRDKAVSFFSKDKFALMKSVGWFERGLEVPIINTEKFLPSLS